MSDDDMTISTSSLKKFNLSIDESYHFYSTQLNAKLETIFLLRFLNISQNDDGIIFWQINSLSDNRQHRTDLE